MSVKVNIQNIGPRWHTGPKEQKDYGVREPGPTNCPDNWSVLCDEQSLWGTQLQLFLSFYYMKMSLKKR